MEVEYESSGGKCYSVKHSVEATLCSYSSSGIFAFD